MKLQNLIHILIGIVCIGLLPKSQALSPAPDGGYPGGNTAEGQSALLSLTSGGFNTAVGFLSLRSNATGQLNTAIGAGTLLANTADGNTATGAGALFSNTTGPSNTATGAFALFSNTTNGGSTATGYQALFNNTGFGNTADGYQALYSNTTGSLNTALGNSAGLSITGDGNVCIGQGLPGAVGVSNTTWIRNVYDSVASGRAIYVDPDNKIGTLSSSLRYKDEIRPIARASEAILSLRPVSFRYKKEVDPTRSLSFGLIAEEVAQVDPDLVTADRAGKPETVRYEAVNAMLLNEFLNAHRKIEEQEATITQLKSTVTRQEETLAQQRKDFEATTAKQQKGMEAVVGRLNEQAAQIQKVSNQLAAASPSRGGLNVSKFATGRIRRGGTAPQIVLNNQ